MKVFFLILMVMMTSNALASDLNLNSAYGMQITGCVQGTVQTTGNNRLLVPWTNKHVLVWCESSSDFSVGDACRFVMGGTTIDVTALTSPTRVGETVFANQPRPVWVSAQYPYISAISKTASSKINVCKMN